MLVFFVLRGKACPVQNPSEYVDDRRLWLGVGGNPRHGRTQRLGPDAKSSPVPPESKFQVRPRARGGAVLPRAPFASANRALHAGWRCSFQRGATAALNSWRPRICLEELARRVPP